MIKKIMYDSVKIISVTASSVSLYEYYNKLNDEGLKRQIMNLQAENRKLSDKVFKDEIMGLQDELTKIKLESCKNQLVELCGSVKHESELLNKLDLNNLYAISDSKHHLLNLINDTKKSNEILDKIVNLLQITPPSNNNFLGDSNWLSSIKDFIKNWSEMLSNLTLEQLGALAHITSSIFILLCLLTIIGIIYSDFLLNYFKLEEKFPRIGRFLKIRKMFQQYYLFINFLLIILTLLAIILVNCKVLLL